MRIDESFYQKVYQKMLFTVLLKVELLQRTIVERRAGATVEF
jgi:hypothetical protein